MDDKIKALVAAAKSTNQTAREIGIKKLKELGLDENGSPVSEKKEPAPAKEKPTKPAAKKSPKKKKAAPAKKEAPKDVAPDYDCEDLIAKAKDRRKKAKEAAKKRANEPQKLPATKNKESVEKTATKIEKSVSKRVQKGEVSVAEIDKIISEYEDAIKRLRELRKKAEELTKMERGGSVDSSKYHEINTGIQEIKESACGCGGKMAEGGNTPKRYDLYGYKKASDRIQDADTIIHAASLDGLEKTSKKYLTDNNYELVEAYRMGQFIGSIRKGQDFVYSSRADLKMEKGGSAVKLKSGVYRVGKPKKISPVLYEQKIVEIFQNGDIGTASDYGRKISDFKAQKYPIITKEQLDAQYKFAEGGSASANVLSMPEYMVEQIRESSDLGYNTVKTGMISPKRKGVMLVNEKDQVRGTYPLEFKQWIEEIISGKHAKGGRLVKKGGREYPTGSAWAVEHNKRNKSEEWEQHEAGGRVQRPHRPNTHWKVVYMNRRGKKITRMEEMGPAADREDVKMQMRRLFFKDDGDNVHTVISIEKIR